MMMRYAKIVFSITVLIAVSALSGCIKELIVDTPEQQGLRVRFHITMSQEQIVNSRAEDDGVTNDIYVMVLDGLGDQAKVTDWAEATSAGSSIYYASLDNATTEGYVCVASNISRTIAGLGDVTWKGLTLSEVKSKLKVQLRKSGGNIVEDPVFAPMVSEILDFSAPNAIKDAESISFDLKRATAKVLVLNSSGNRNFTLLGANMGNAPSYGYLFEGGAPISAVDCANYAGLQSGNNYSPEVMMRGVDKSVRNQTEPLYLFESPASNAVFVIIKCQYEGVTGYHRINLWDPQTETNLPIVRNTQYRINITKVNSAGYASARDAIADPDPMNKHIEVDIEVTDDVSKDIVSNGEYYLGVENSKFVVYSDNDLTQYLVTSVAHNAPTGITGTVTAKTIEGEGSIGITSNPFKPGNNTVQTGELRITLPKTIEHGEIILRLGNLSRRINIERRKDAISMGGNIPLSKVYAYGKVNGDGDQWLRLTANGTTPFDDATSEYVNPNTDHTALYMSLANNVIYDAESKHVRMSEIVLFNAEDDGHTKVAVFQPPFDIFGKPEVTTGRIITPYAGAFWRYNQTGERVINMTIEGTPTTISWDAQVAVGHDWIRLQSGGSSDPKIYTIDAMLGDNASFEGLHQLTDKTKTAIHGNAETVAFRIGIVGNKLYPDGQIGKSDHRYGLVLVNTYVEGNLQNTYRIFIRQGDAPDYLFRESDGGYDGWSTPRSLATKLSAYNLTDPALGVGTAVKSTSVDEVNPGNIPKHSVMPLDYYLPTENRNFNPAKFTKFPSQAGYCFVWNVKTDDVDEVSLARNLNLMRAYHPLNNISLQHLYFAGDRESYLSGNPYGEFPLIYNPASDPCPYGYRYPQLGKTHPGDITTLHATESELMQSLLYDPLAPTRGSAPGIMGRYTCWGYYADGFFDRMPLTKSRAVNSYRLESFVMRADNVKNATGNDIGYSGMVIFNPFNFSSIFFPATGYIFPVNTSPMINPSKAIYMWVSERDDSSIGRVCYPIDLSGSKGSFSIITSQGGSAMARPVRCVRDEKTWPDNGE